MNKRTLFLGLTCLMAVAHLTLADEQTVSSTQAPAIKRSERPFWIYGSAAGGFGNITGSEYGQDPTGGEVLLGGILSYKMPKWVIDLGIGWMSSTIEGKMLDGTPLTVKTRAGFFELSPRFRLTENLQLGLSIMSLYGTDTGFSGRLDESSTNFLIGPKLAYEIPSNLIQTRLFIQMNNSIGLSDRNALLTIAGIQIGLPIGKEPQEKQIVKEVVVVTQAAPAPKAVFTPSKIELAEEIKFRHASDVLLPSSQALLDEVANVIKSHKGAYSRIAIEGHTNYLGTEEYNQKLSERRALSVKEYLVARGITSEELDTIGWGKSRPKAGIESLSKAAQRVANRRVEFTVVP